MTRVAQQRRAAVAPARDWLAIEQRPTETRVGTLDDRGDRLCPAGEVGGEIGLLAAFGPAFALPIGALHDTDEVHQFAAAKIVRHGVPSGPDPDARRLRYEALQGGIGGHDEAPGRATREARPLGAEHRA